MSLDKDLHSDSFASTKSIKTLKNKTQNQRLTRIAKLGSSKTMGKIF